MKFSIVQFEFLCKLLDNPDFDLADLDWCAYEGAAEYMSEIGKRRRSV